MDPGEDPDLELLTKNIQPKIASSGNAARSWQWRERGLNPRHAAINKRVLEDTAEDHLVYKEKHEERACHLPGHPRSTFLMVFSPDGTKVASTHGNHMVYVSDVASGKHVRTLQGHPRTPWCIAFHPSHTQIIGSGCLGGQVRVWDLSGGSEVWAVGSVTVIASIAFHPRDQLLVIATHNELYFWDWSQPQPFTKICTNNINEKVRYVSFDSLGHKLITGISIWPSPEPLRNVERVFTTSSPTLAAAPLQPSDSPPPSPVLSDGSSNAHMQMVTSYQTLVQRYDTLVRNYHRLFLASQSTNTTDRGTDPMEDDTEDSPGSSRSPLIGANPLIGGAGATRHAPTRAQSYTSTELPPPPLLPHNMIHNQSHYHHNNLSDILTSNRRRRCNRLFDRDEGIIPRQLQGVNPEIRQQFVLVLDRLQSYMENSIEETLEFWKRYDEASRTPEEPNGQPSSSRPDTSRPPHPRSQSLEHVEQRSMLREFLARRHAARVAERNRSNNINNDSHLAQLSTSAATLRCPRYRHFSASAARERYRLDRITDSDRSKETIALWLKLIRNIIQNSGRSLRTVVNETPDSRVESSVLRGQHSDLYRYLSVMERSEAELHRERALSSSDSDSSDHVQILRTRNRSVTSDQQSNIFTNELEQENTRETADNGNDNIEGRGDAAQAEALPAVPGATPLLDDHTLMNRLALRKIKLSIDALHKHMESLSALWAVNTPHPTLGQIRSLWENLHREVISLFRSPTGDTNSSYFTRPLSARCRMLNTTNRNSSNTQSVMPQEAASTEPRPVPSQQMGSRGDLNNLTSADFPRDNRENTSSESSQSSSDSSSTETDNDNNLPSTSSGVNARLTSRKRRNQTNSIIRRRITSARTKTPIELALRFATPSSNYNFRTDQEFRQFMRSTTSVVLRHSRRNTRPSQASPYLRSEEESSGPNAELNITRHGVRFCARRLINIIVNVMMDCLEDEDLSNQLTIILQILKKSLGVTCLLLMSENIITQGRRETGNEPQPSTSGVAPSVPPSRNFAPAGLFVHQDQFSSTSPEETLSNSHLRNSTRERRNSTDEQTTSTSRATQRTTRDRSDSVKGLRRCTSQPKIADRNHRQTSSNENQQPPTNENSSETTEQKNSTMRSQDSSISQSPVPLPSAEVVPGPSTSWKPASVQSEGSGAAELSDRIAVQISAVNKNNSNIAQYRRDLYNQRRRQIAMQRYNPLSGRPNPSRHRRDERDRNSTLSHIRSSLRRPSTGRTSSVVHRRPRLRNSNLAVDSELYIPNERPDNRVCSQTRPMNVSSPIDEEARLAGIQARLRSTPRASSYRLRLYSSNRQARRESQLDADAGHSDSADTESERRWGTGELESVLRHVTVPLVQVNDVPLGEVAVAEAQAQPHDFVQPIIIAQNAMMLNEEEMPTHGVLEPGARIVSDPLASTVHRVQAWDFTNGAIPDITDATKNVVVQKCKIHNDASIDISRDGRMLVALLPAQRIRHVTHRLGVYSLEWKSLGVCLYSSLLEQNAVSVALSPSARYLAVGLGSRRVTFLPSGRSRAMAVLFKLKPQSNKEHRPGRGELTAARVLEQIWESGFTSLNCFRWAPAPGQGFVYANNTGQLKILS